MSDSEDGYVIPLVRPAAYGIGIKKRGIKFVGAGHLHTSTSNTELRSGDDIANAYLQIVLDKAPADISLPFSTSECPEAGEKTSATDTSLAPPSSWVALTNDSAHSSLTLNCEVCNLPVQVDGDFLRHHSSLAHQVCLTHTLPPNAIDRSRKGVVYLQNQGWDPDSRLGLGAQGEGIRHPITTKEKKDKAGLGQQEARKERILALLCEGKIERQRGMNPKALKKVEA